MVRPEGFEPPTLWFVVYQSTYYQRLTRRDWKRKVLKRNDRAF